MKINFEKIKLFKCTRPEDFLAYFKEERRVLKSVLRRQFVLYGIAGFIHNYKDLRLIYKFTNAYVDELLRLIVFNGRSGFALFKDKVNYLIHFILQCSKDSNVKKSFRLSRPYYTMIGIIQKYSNFNKFDEVVFQTLKSYVISVLNTYRIILFDTKLDHEPITSQYNGKLDLVSESDLFYQRLYAVCSIFKKKISTEDNVDTNAFNFQALLTAGPNANPSINGIFKDYTAIKGEDILRHIINFEQIDEPQRENRRLSFDFHDILNYFERKCKNKMWKQKAHFKSKWITSKLHLLQDKAGKTRNIAITDNFSQACLFNLHKKLFEVLKLFRTDGTFNISRQWGRIQRALTKQQTVYSIDMSSCTERFPVMVQKFVLKSLGILTSEQSEAWMNILTDRTFYVRMPSKITIRLSDITCNTFNWKLFKRLLFKSYRSRKYKYLKLNKKLDSYEKLIDKYINRVKEDSLYIYKYERFLRIRYEVGQPMGMFSSWAAMSVSHHMLVWVSYWIYLNDLHDSYLALYEDSRLLLSREFNKALKQKLKRNMYNQLRLYKNHNRLVSNFIDGKTVFKNYSILGDDIVIYDEPVAKIYLKVLNLLGIKVSLNKSFISDRVAEFAKVYIYKDRVLKPVSPNLILNLSNNKLGWKIRTRCFGEILALVKWNRLSLITLENICLATYCRNWVLKLGYYLIYRKVWKFVPSLFSSNVDISKNVSLLCNIYHIRIRSIIKDILFVRKHLLGIFYICQVIGFRPDFVFYFSKKFEFNILRLSFKKVIKSYFIYFEINFNYISCANELLFENNNWSPLVGKFTSCWKEMLAMLGDFYEICYYITSIESTSLLYLLELGLDFSFIQSVEKYINNFEEFSCLIFPDQFIDIVERELLVVNFEKLKNLLNSLSAIDFSLIFDFDLDEKIIFIHDLLFKAYKGAVVLQNFQFETISVERYTFLSKVNKRLRCIYDLILKKQVDATLGPFEVIYKSSVRDIEELPQSSYNPGFSFLNEFDTITQGSRITCKSINVPMVI